MKPAPHPRTALLITLATFLFGALTGGFLTAAWMGNDVMRFIRHGPRHFNDYLFQLMNSDLNLDDKQQAEMKIVTGKISREMEDLHQQFRPRFLEIIDRHVPEIEKILRPDQVLKFRKREEQRRKEHLKSFPGGPPPPLPDH